MTLISTIKTEIFNNCDQLTTIKWSKELTETEDNAFSNTNITTGDFTNTKLTRILNGAFYNSDFTSIIFPTTTTI